jgi:peptide/nickel transport system permease protein
MLITKKQKQEHVESLERIATRRHSQTRDIIRRLFRSKLAVIGTIIVAVILIMTIFAPLFTPYNYETIDLANRFQMPNLKHIFGTDNYGRDLYTRLLYGGRISLLVAVISVAISLVTGSILGAIVGYFQGWVDTIIMRILDIVMAIPGMLLAVVVSAALGTGVMSTAVAVSIGGIPSSARIMRSTVMQLRDQEFVEAARATGSTNARIIFKHIIPNTLAPIIVDSTLRIGGSIMQISGLSFVGLGVQPPTPEWGSILSGGRSYLRDFWPLVVFPGLCIMLTLFGFNLFGDGLRDALDPKLKQ